MANIPTDSYGFAWYRVSFMMNWIRKTLTVWKEKFWQFEKENFDSLKRKFWNFWQFNFIILVGRIRANRNFHKHPKHQHSIGFQEKECGVWNCTRMLCRWSVEKLQKETGDNQEECLSNDRESVGCVSF
jgi:hypothetical protein